VPQRAGGGFGPVQTADDPDQLVVGGAGEPGVVAGRVLGQAEQRRATGRDI
jgi:hypothetical protein